jgi:hypothetical protein
MHQTVPMEGLAVVAQPANTVALAWHSGARTLILTLAELLLLVWLLLRWLVRRQGGWRRAWRRLSRETRLTFQAFSEPLREFLRFRVAVRRLTRILTAGVPTVAHHALDHVDTAVTRTAAEAFGFAATVRPGTRRGDGDVTVRVAGRGVPPAGQPWRTDGDPLIWYAPIADVEGSASRTAAPDTNGAEERPATPRLLVPLGLSSDGMVFLDLLRGPRILSTYGDRRATRSFVQAVAAYLDMPGGEAEVVVARGVDPRFDGPDLNALLASVPDLTVERNRPVVVVCAAPDDEQSAQLSRMAAAGLLCALVAGPMPSYRWELRVDSRGRTKTPGLGIETEAGPLGPAVARTARKLGADAKNRARAKGAPARPAPTAPSPAAPSPAAPAPTAPSPAARARSVAGTDRRTVPATVTPHTTGPLAPAVRDLFAEPEATGVSATGTRDAESFEHPGAERENRS